MIEKWEKRVHSRKVFIAVLMIFQRLFDCISNRILVANLNSHGFDLKWLRFIDDYFSNKKQKVTANTTFVSCSHILAVIPKEYILVTFFLIYIHEIYSFEQMVLM